MNSQERKRYLKIAQCYLKIAQWGINWLHIPMRGFVLSKQDRLLLDELWEYSDRETLITDNRVRLTASLAMSEAYKP